MRARRGATLIQLIWAIAVGAMVLNLAGTVYETARRTAALRVAQVRVSEALRSGTHWIEADVRSAARISTETGRLLLEQRRVDGRLLQVEYRPTAAGLLRVVRSGGRVVERRVCADHFRSVKWTTDGRSLRVDLTCALAVGKREVVRSVVCSTSRRAGE